MYRRYAGRANFFLNFGEFRFGGPLAEAAIGLMLYVLRIAGYDDRSNSSASLFVH